MDACSSSGHPLACACNVCKCTYASEVLCTEEWLSVVCLSNQLISVVYLSNQLYASPLCPCDVCMSKLYVCTSKLYVVQGGVHQCSVCIKSAEISSNQLIIVVCLSRQLYSSTQCTLRCVYE